MGLLATVGLLGLARKADLAIAAPPKPKLVVLDIELAGDLGGPRFTAEHAVRLRTQSAILRHALEASGLHQVLDNTPALPLINQLKSQQAYWHDCNGCDLQVGRQRRGVDAHHCVHGAGSKGEPREVGPNGSVCFSVGSALTVHPPPSARISATDPCVARERNATGNLRPCPPGSCAGPDQ
jgi:hypothetical protein